jgi:hypothetical protein
MRDPATDVLIQSLLSNAQERYSGGLERLLSYLSGGDGRERFEEWRRLPATELFVAAIKSLTDTCASGIQSDPTGIAVAYGVTSGINLAARLLDDPTRVFPSMFEKPGTAKFSGPVAETYRAPDGHAGARNRL